MPKINHGYNKQKKIGTHGCIKAQNNLSDTLRLEQTQDLRGKIARLENTLRSLRLANDTLISAVDNNSMEKFFTENFDMETAVASMKEHIESRIRHLTQAEQSDLPNTSGASGGQSDQRQAVSVKLERLKAEQYDGNPLTYQVWWDRFKGRVHDNTAVSDVDKFEYLLASLTGPALTAIANLTPTAANYHDS